MSLGYIQLDPDHEISRSTLGIGCHTAKIKDRDITRFGDAYGLTSTTATPTTFGPTDYKICWFIKVFTQDLTAISGM